MIPFRHTKEGQAGRCGFKLPPGYSLPELLLAITIIAVLGAIAIPILGGLLPTATHQVADSNLKKLNAAVVGYNQGVAALNPQTTDGASDLEIVRSLQYTAPVGPGGFRSYPGTPYFEPRAQVSITSSTNSFRATWNGRMFEMIRPGNAGSGVDLMQLANATEPFSPGGGFRPLGAR